MMSRWLKRLAEDSNLLNHPKDKREMGLTWAQTPATQGDPQDVRLFYWQKHYHLGQQRMKTKENKGRLLDSKCSRQELG